MVRIVWVVSLTVGLGVGLPGIAKVAHADPPAYWITLERGDSLAAQAVETAAIDFVRFRRPDGSVGYVPTNRIAHIYDAIGSDLRDVVLDHRKRLGEPIKARQGDYRSFSFRGGDKSRCGSFLLTETAVWVALAGHESEQNLFGSGDLGAMANVGRHSAVGASAFWESGSNFNRGGVRLRYRRWLGPRTSIELSPGVVFDGNDTYDAPGFVGQVGLNAGDFISLVLEAEHDRYIVTPYTYDYTVGYVPGPAQHTSGTTLRLGLRGGSYVGVGAGLLAGIGIAAIASSFNGSLW